MIAELDQTLYRKMLTIRLLEDKLQQLCLAGEASDLHFSKGQEAISVGVCSQLMPADYTVTHHRTITHAIARGVPLKPLVAEILGKKTGICEGVAGEMHLHYRPIRYMFSFQLVGTCVSVAAGLAWAVKNYLNTQDIVAVFLGDAATSNAQFHEGLNLAAVQKVPLLIVIEDNHLAGNITPSYYLPTYIDDRFKAYAVRTKSVDGNDMGAIRLAALESIGWVRTHSRPFALICDTTRLCWHKQGQRDTRTQEQLNELAKRDPIQKIPEDVKAKLVLEISLEIQDAIDSARKD